MWGKKGSLKQIHVELLCLAAEPASYALKYDLVFIELLAHLLAFVQALQIKVAHFMKNTRVIIFPRASIFC